MITISVRELSEELGISKQAIHKRMEQLPPQFQPEMVDGVYELTLEIADAIRLSKKESTIVNQPTVDPIDLLNMQISELKEDKKRLYKQLDQFQTLLDQQQQLTLQSNQQIQLQKGDQQQQLTLQLKAYEKEENEEATNTISEKVSTNEKQTRKWWKFWI